MLQEYCPPRITAQHKQVVEPFVAHVTMRKSSQSLADHHARVRCRILSKGGSLMDQQQQRAVLLTAPAHSCSLRSERSQQHRLWLLHSQLLPRSSLSGHLDLR
eukprot:6491713-Amphidinium_carterae.1